MRIRIIGKNILPIVISITITIIILLIYTVLIMCQELLILI